MAEIRPWTEEEHRRVAAMRGKKMSFREIGDKIGRTETSVRARARKYARGEWKPKRSALSIARDALVEKLVAEGEWRTSVIARELGVTMPSACQRMGRLGLDAEMRRAAAAEQFRP